MDRYKNFIDSNGMFLPNTDAKFVSKLKPGCYTPKFNHNSQQFYFEQIEITADSILDLPSPEYTQIVKEMTDFMSKEIRQKFKKLGYVYKRSTLLHGKPGTGKTIISNRIAMDIMKSGGITLWVDVKNIDLLEHAFDVLKDVQPETLIGVFFEEFDNIASKHESMLLTLLDGQVQKDNVIYLATTNYIENVPKRLYRPGRFSSVIEIKFPTMEARKKYLGIKLGENFKDLKNWVKISEDLSIDELKELVQAVHILGQPMDKVLNRIRDTKDITNLPIEKKKNSNSISYNDIIDTMNGFGESLFTVNPSGKGKLR